MTFKPYSLILTLILLLCGSSVSAAEGNWSSYKKQPTSSGNYYYISEGAHLAWIANYVCSFNLFQDNTLSGKTLLITNDIDLSEHYWDIPIGVNSAYCFSGSVKGWDIATNKSVERILSGLTIYTSVDASVNPGVVYASLFGYVKYNRSNVVFENLTVENASVVGIITNTNNSKELIPVYAAGLIAEMHLGQSNTTPLKNCTIKNSIIKAISSSKFSSNNDTGYCGAGGLVGYFRALNNGAMYFDDLNNVNSKILAEANGTSYAVCGGIFSVIACTSSGAHLQFRRMKGLNSSMIAEAAQKPAYSGALIGASIIRKSDTNRILFEDCSVDGCKISAKGHAGYAGGFLGAKETGTNIEVSTGITDVELGGDFIVESSQFEGDIVGIFVSNPAADKVPPGNTDFESGNNSVNNDNNGGADSDRIKVDLTARSFSDPQVVYGDGVIYLRGKGNYLIFNTNPAITLDTRGAEGLIECSRQGYNVTKREYTQKGERLYTTNQSILPDWDKVGKTETIENVASDGTITVALVSHSLVADGTGMLTINGKRVRVYYFLQTSQYNETISTPSTINPVVRNLIIGSGITQTGTISYVETLDIYDGAYLSEDGIGNEVGPYGARGEIVYHRTPSCYASGGNGWESVCLPFDAELYADGVRKIFFHSTMSGGTYWLKELDAFSYTSGMDLLSLQLKSPAGESNTVLKANVPYLVALPSDAWGWENDMRGMEITFRGTGSIPTYTRNNYVYVEDGLTKCYFQGTFKGVNLGSEGARCYLSNAIGECENNIEPDENTVWLGDRFPINATAKVKPFRAYFVFNKQSDSAIGAKSARVSTESMALGFEDVESRVVKIYKDGAYLCIESDSDRNVDIYNSLGQSCGTYLVNVGINRIELPVGMYLVDGIKVVL